MRKNIKLIGTIGGVLGSISGIIELSIGKQILPWIGNKENPVVLGLITFFLSVMALFAARSQMKTGKFSNDKKLAVFFGVFLPAVICFTTVGRLWYIPGFLLLVTAIFIAHNNWLKSSKGDLNRISSAPDWGFRILGGLGSVIILASIALSLNYSQFGLLYSELNVKAGKFTIEIIPMDIVRITNFSRNVAIVEDNEVRLVMIIYLLLIIGAVLSLTACLTKSRLFTRIGSVIVSIGYILFPIYLPQLLRVSEISPEAIHFSIGSLALGWYLITIGLGLLIIACFSIEKK